VASRGVLLAELHPPLLGRRTFFRRDMRLKLDGVRSRRRGRVDERMRKIDAPVMCLGHLRDNKHGMFRPDLSISD
jgi:hypothetical protein